MENSRPTAALIDAGARLTKTTEKDKLVNQELYQQL